MALAMALASTLGCATSACRLDDYRGVACRAAAAREELVYGLSREAAIDALGRAEVEPPWKNDLDLGPTVIRNPFDSETVQSAIGEEYEVVRFFVRASGTSRCPFIQGELELEPLIFVDGQLVGWRWSYLEDLTGQPVPMEARRWTFGAFCEGRRANPPESTPSESQSPADNSDE